MAKCQHIRRDSHAFSLPMGFDYMYFDKTVPIGSHGGAHITLEIEQREKSISFFCIFCSERKLHLTVYYKINSYLIRRM